MLIAVCVNRLSCKLNVNYYEYDLSHHCLLLYCATVNVLKCLIFTAVHISRAGTVNQRAGCWYPLSTEAYNIKTVHHS